MQNETKQFLTTLYTGYGTRELCDENIDNFIARTEKHLAGDEGQERWLMAFAHIMFERGIAFAENKDE